jgi:hypothetical protein
MTSPLRTTFQGLALTLCWALSPFAAAATPLDATLFTGYTLLSDYSGVSFFVCGSVPGSDGCYGSGTLGPFKHIGAMLEGGPRTVGDVVSRNIYIVDVAGGTTGTDVVLYRYVLTNTVTPPYDAVAYKLLKQVTLPLTGGAKSRCSMAANAGYLFIGTDQSTSAVRVTKNGFALQSIGGFSNNPTVASITTDANGFVIVTFNGTGGGGFVAFGPNGQAEEDGGGMWFTVPTNQGISTQDVPAG